MKEEFSERCGQYLQLFSLFWDDTQCQNTEKENCASGGEEQRETGQ